MMEEYYDDLPDNVVPPAVNISGNKKVTNYAEWVQELTEEGLARNLLAGRARCKCFLGILEKQRCRSRLMHPKHFSSLDSTRQKPWLAALIASDRVAVAILNWPRRLPETAPDRQEPDSYDSLRKI